MRLFTAIDIPEDVQHRLSHFIARLRPTAHIHWSAVYNLHITLKFIGEWPEEDCEQLHVALSRISKKPSTVAIAIKQLGWFPDSRRPRVFWAGVNGGLELNALAAAIDSALQPLGVAKETRAYTPHLTLARVRDREPLEGLHRALDGVSDPDFGSFTADRFFLYRSQSGPAGTVYTKLREYALAA